MAAGTKLFSFKQKNMLICTLGLEAETHYAADVAATLVTIWFSEFLFVTHKYPNHDTKEKGNLNKSMIFFFLHSASQFASKFSTESIIVPRYS